LLEKPKTSAQQQVRKMLIVERKLVRNNGHFHTQISALQRLLPNHSCHILAGDGYDDFLGPAVGKFGVDASKLAKLAARAKYGSIRQKLAAFLTIAMRGKPSLRPPEPMADTLVEACKRLGLSRQDLVIIPSADLNMLEAAQIVAERLGSKAPAICLRFLSPDFGEHDHAIRKRALNAAAKMNSDRITLFSETVEFAGYAQAQFGLSIHPYFYLPCSIELTATQPCKTGNIRTFRVGIFGAPRLEKGSRRLHGIVEATAQATQSSTPPIQFIIQGSEPDFGNSGIYKDLASFASHNGKVSVEQHSALMDQDDFIALFQSVDAVLLPYEVSLYSLQGSGVVQDAVAARKLIIHSDNMAMAEMLSHGNAFGATTNEEFAREIVKTTNISQADVESATEQAFAHFQRGQKNHPISKVFL
jgi:hypothetical protein